MIFARFYNFLQIILHYSPSDVQTRIYHPIWLQPNYSLSSSFLNSSFFLNYIISNIIIIKFCFQKPLIRPFYSKIRELWEIVKLHIIVTFAPKQSKDEVWTPRISYRHLSHDNGLDLTLSPVLIYCMIFILSS